jgi:hypothetical protein
MIVNNTHRALWAGQALDTFAQNTFYRDAKEAIQDEGDTIVIGDMLSNLMHFCHQNGFDFDACVSAGKRHFDHEIKYPDE